MKEKILKIKEEIIQQFAKVENILKVSIQGLQERDAAILKNIIHVMEPQVNSRELSIEERCTNYIALFTPEAKNLRYILMMLKMNSEAERAGDLGVNIAESSLYLIKRPAIHKNILKETVNMANSAITMLHDSITAFMNEDFSLAEEVIQRDYSVNSLQEHILTELKSLMISDSAVIKRGLHFIRIAHNLERVGDLATNICEDTIYIINGEIVRHKKRINITELSN